MNLSLKLIEHLVYPNKSLHEPLKRQYCWRKKPRLLEIGRLNERIEIQPNKRDRHKEKNRVVNYNQKVIEMHMFFVLFVCLFPFYRRNELLSNVVNFRTSTKDNLVKLESKSMKFFCIQYLLCHRYSLYTYTI